MINEFRGMVASPFNLILADYEKDEELELNFKFNEESEGLDVLGKFTMAGGALAFLVSYISYDQSHRLGRFEKVGKVVSVAATMTGIAMEILGYDLQIAAQNLQNYFNAKEYKKGERLPEEVFKKQLIETATKGTFTKEYIFPAILQSP